MSVLMIGPFPPPVHGQAAATLATAKMLADAGLVVCRYDTGEGQSASRASRLARLLGALPRIASGSEGHVYISVNANLGMSITFLYCLLARLRGRAITLHHHAYNYIANHSPWAAAVARAAGRDAMHLTQCETMGRALVRQYPAIRRCLSFSNVGFLAEQADAGPQLAPLTFGHMSNLTESKGLGVAIDTLRRALSDGLDASLIVAGPCSDDFAWRSIDSAKLEFRDRFIYLGPVYGKEKGRFFRAIDLFLFPSRYRNETQGIVVLEALSYAAPVVAYGQCCLAETVGTDGGVVVADDGDFAAVSIALAKRYRAAPHDTRSLAHRQFRRLAQAHRLDHATLTAYFQASSDCCAVTR